MEPCDTLSGGFRSAGGGGMLKDYFPIALYFIVALVVGLGVLGASRVMGPRKPNAAKLQTYECGMTPETEIGPRFSVKFYLVAMLFMIFDVEAVSFYPWAVLMHQLRLFGLLEMALFILVLGIGYAYVWKRGGFQWQE
jgi:NADH-quinone oxidoreductase subunit A